MKQQIIRHGTIIFSIVLIPFVINEIYLYTQKDWCGIHQTYHKNGLMVDGTKCEDDSVWCNLCNRNHSVYRMRNHW